MDEEQIDEREMLKKKIKLLEEEIVERTRNYMQSSRHTKKSVTNIPMAQKEVQTDDYLQRYSRGPASDDGEDAEVDLKELEDQFDGILHGFQQIANIRVKEQAKNKNKMAQAGDESQMQIYTKLLKLNKDSQIDLLNSLINSLTSPNSSFVLTAATLLQQLQKIRSEYLPFYSSLYTSAFKLFETQRKQYDKCLRSSKQLEVRCEFITKALNESEETNYQLRLKNQDYQSRLRKADQNIIKSEKALSQNELNESKIEQLKLKVQQLEVMKKEYLRAYSKIKQEKQEVELKLLDLSDELENLQKLNLQQNGQGWSHDFQVEEQSHEQTRLKTIIQHSEDELIEGVIRQTGQNSLSAIRQIIEHGLMETNRSTSQKWIKSALIKIQQFEHSHEEQLEKVVLSQSQMELAIHDKYKMLLTNIKRHVIKEKKQLQDEFNKTLSKIIGYQQQRKGEGEAQVNEIMLPLVKKSSLSNSSSPKQQKMSQNDEIEQSNQQPDRQSAIIQQKNIQIQNLTKRLEQCNRSLAELRIKFEALLSKSSNSSQFFATNQAKSSLYFRQFMNKLISAHSIAHNEKFTQELFDRLAHKIFETLCNLPVGNHGQVFFVPTNQEELEDAVAVIYNFSLEFDKLQENRVKQFKNEAMSLTKMLEQIVVANDVPAEMVIESMHHNLDEQNSLSGGYVKSMIKKISAEQGQKSKQLHAVPKQQQTINSYQSAKSDD